MDYNAFAVTKGLNYLLTFKAMLKVYIYATSSREDTFRKLGEKLLKRKEKEKEKKWCLKIRTVDVYRYGRWESVVRVTSYLKHSTSKAPS